ncbi:MAG: glycosyltransferase [Fibromonadaceae bacterium]|nr:glycosyltransferase [Fibromonadaceae bacterium]
MPIVSIIVPVYKVEKYLPRCLDSILAQTFVDFECILVDDDSPDNCPAICDEYVSRDNRIVVIHRDNKGVAVARDTGLKKAKGEFICFVDSDDWIEPRALELLHKKQQETNADIVLGSIKNIFLWKTDTYINPEIPTDMLPIVYFLLYGFKGPVAKLFKKSLFQNYVIPDTHVGEDLIVNAQVFSIVQPGKLQKIDEIVYVYDRRTDGVINNTIKSMKNYDSYLEDPNIKSRLWVKQYFDAPEQNELVKIACLYLVYEAIIQYMRFCCRNIKKNETALFYKEYHKKLLNNKCLKNIPIRDRIIVPIFYFSMPLGKAYIKILDFLYCVKRLLRNKNR